MKPWIILSVALLAGCSTGRQVTDFLAPTLKGGYYVVRADDTLDSIAWRYRISTDDLIRWNNLSPPYPITMGQRLVLFGAYVPGQATAPATQRVVKPTPAQTATPAREVPLQPIIAALPSDEEILVESQQIDVKKSIRRVDGGKARQIAGKTWVWPVSGSLIKQFNSDNGENRRVDVLVDSAQPVNASSAADVIFVGDLPLLGLTVILDHGSDLITSYSNLEKVSVSEGVSVTNGQAIGVISASSELHVEFRKMGEPVDPQNYFP
ncbi:MAG: M23 family metallopeptidase [Gammaproteobacteria bacterium]|nr:M23 family metallopeptidase [Gammaproteobacteria bacterium]